MYDEKPKPREDILPTVSIQKEARDQLMRNGPPTNVKFEFPPYIEFDLIDDPYPGKKWKRKERKRKETDRAFPDEKPFTCGVCGTTLKYGKNARRHLMSHENLSSNIKYFLLLIKRLKLLTLSQFNKSS